VTLRTRLTAAFLVVVLVPLLVVLAVVASTLPDRLARVEEAGLRGSSLLVAELVQSRCDRAGAAAEVAARTASATTRADDPRLLDVVRDLVARGVADGVRVTRPGGGTAATAGTAPEVPAQDCTSGTPTVTGGVVHITALVPLGQPGVTTDPPGAAVASFTVDDALAVELAGLMGSAEVALLVDGRPVATSGEVPTALLEAAQDRRASESRTLRRGGRIGVLVPAGTGQPVAVLVVERGRDRASVLPPILGITVLALLMAVGIALLVARATTRPLGELGAAAARVAGGDLNTTIEVRSRDELGLLATSFNTMTEELRRYVGALQASRDELQAGVARLGDALAGTHNVDRIVSVVLDTAMAATRARAGAVWLVGADGRTLEIGACDGFAGGPPPPAELPVGSGIVGRVARSGEPLRGRQGAGDLVPAPGEPAAGTLLAVPLRSSSRVIGVLAVYDREDGEPFDEDDLATLRTFTSQATVAVDNVQLHEEARRLSLTDALTGLWNYRYFTMTVGKEIERATRFERPLALLLLDLDHFKLVNDIYGHQRGDAVLVELGSRVRAQVREVDTLARYGGEEFVVLLPETDTEGAALAAERIRSAVQRRPFGEPGDTPLDITVSVGAAVYPVHGSSATTLVGRADEALYAAKRAGRDSWRLADVPRTP
jgi:diguanylate cyclase (GGDEF)-like protein